MGLVKSFGVIGVLSLSLIACQNTPQQASMSPSPLSSDSVKELQPSASASVSVQDFVEVLSRNFDHFVKLSPTGVSPDYLMALTDTEFLYIAIDPVSRQNQLWTYESEEDKSAVLWEGNEQIDVNSFRYVKVEGEDGGTVRFSTYLDGTSNGYAISRQSIRETDPYEQLSPDKTWSAIVKADQGIWGVEQKTGKQERWTQGNQDRQPLWFPDGSQFVYLASTGVQLGDGAGEATTLAIFDVESRKTKKLSFEEGFWGGIRWLTPGKTILADNGFDDVIGLKVVNLYTNQEKQIYMDDISNYSNHAYNPILKQLLVSTEGQFVIYDEDGNALIEQPWGDGWDEYSRKNPDFGKSKESYEPFYGAGEDGGWYGLHSFAFSPDGKYLAYSIGTMGSSIYDKVQGSKVILSLADGSNPKLLTNDYLDIRRLQWLPSSHQVIILVGRPNSDDTYLAWINLE
ncbi:PD40 domain-containing protein [Cohnella luojiensis]|uniref:WD40 repeat domain-containing protein n=1 Tax=Cohnella luojiensis TaxID=652876 RepID=A0A4Y8LTI7_9BACL|nr:PD40 domain-containing protein [Cohnella luojiensis]TFE24860.1 hypothetical protein E2980_15050 [Cohnella luojiensis]